jgi:SAM-dependent methyltransferase
MRVFDSQRERQTVRTMHGNTASARPPLPLKTPSSHSPYDFWAPLYDWIVSSRLYHKWFWGMGPEQHTLFARRALEKTGPGPTLDAGCGSLLFTAPCYRRARRPLTLFDASSGMLSRARRRFPSPLAEWVQGDLCALPFEAHSFESVFHFGVLHCLNDAGVVLAELARVTRPGGKLFLSCLTLGKPRGDAFLARLVRGGHVAPARQPEEVLEGMRKAGFQVQNSEQRGSFLFVEAERAA